ncbi:hypothetical protein G6F64_015410 [Rhizopus arrhizus]|uniref:Uncharacterized protein n=1 Tax=Rhizopus oryzae TaxID=64495 RepID=A0A9P7BIB6_RHIOR|nr:hypothetical protein G6F64_015410 [Rhizopus arrhizus]
MIAQRQHDPLAGLQAHRAAQPAGQRLHSGLEAGIRKGRAQTGGQRGLGGIRGGAALEKRAEMHGCLKVEQAAISGQAA